VLKLLAERGAHTLDADAVTHHVQQPGTPVYDQILAAFGPEIATAPGSPLDRKKLAAIVFTDPAALKQLESIVHPAVRAEVWRWLGEVKQTGAGSLQSPVGILQTGDRRPETGDPSTSLRAGRRSGTVVAVIDAVKLLEAGWKQHCNAIWVVTCPEEQQIERLMTTRGMSEDEARMRISAQPPQAWRATQADVVIDNGGSLAETEAQVQRAWQALNDNRNA
jgi:dephospho-CoA kinase